MTAALILFVASIVLAAAALSTFLWRRFAKDAPGAWESAASVAVLSFIIAIAINWTLSWLHLLERGPLVTLAAASAIPALLFLYRSRRVRPFFAISLLEALALSPVLLWIAFCLWRGAIVPVLSHDALAYHLPKAVMLERAHQYEFFPAPDPRISTSPPNYEFLLADFMALTGSDALTEWIGTAAFVALLLLGAALVERWWGAGPQVAVVVLLIAAVPVILLHAGAHKNDLLSNAFYLGALLWGGRWLATRETTPLILSLSCLAAAGGTKLQSVFVAVALLLVWIPRPRLNRAQFFVIVSSIPVAVLFLGGWPYVENLFHTGQVALPAGASSDAGYGDWRNLWEVPLLMLLRPFDSNLVSVYVPWRGERWFWPHYEIYFSDFGIIVSALALTLPIAIARYCRRFATSLLQRERLVGSIAAAIAFFLMMPIRVRPLGFFAGTPRYVCYIAVFVLAWTVAPLVRELSESGRRGIAHVIMAGAAVLMIAIAAEYTIDDSFQPLDYVLHVAEQPAGYRLPHFSRYRAGTILDIVAGPTDTIAVHGGFDSWIYPLYGATLQRNVLFIQPGQPIPQSANFVVVDRAWTTIWGRTGFENMGQFAAYVNTGTPTPEDTAVIRALQNDPRWELRYLVESHCQAIFMRRAQKPSRSVVPTGVPSH